MPKLSFVVVLLLLVVASCTKKAAPAASKEPALDGAPIFAQNCAKCHGATGVEGRAPNLAHDDFTKNEVVDKVTNGAGRMPSFATKLSPKEIDAVAQFVVHLKK